MTGKQQLSLRWTDYLRHVTNAFDSLRCQEDLVDVTLCCEGKQIRAHKMLLSACSTYFKEIFKDNPCQHPVIIFKNVPHEDLSAIIDFMYHGEVNIAQDQLGSFLATAEMLEVEGLTDGLEKNQESITELEMVKDLSTSENFIVSENTFHPKRRKIAFKRRADYDLDTPEQVTELNAGCIIESIDQSRLKVESGEVCEEIDLDISESNVAGPSAISFREEIQICDSESFTGDVLNVLKTTEMNQANADGADLTTDVSREIIQDGDLVKFRCQLCWKGFKHPTSLTLHKDSHTGKTQCPVCRRSFSRSYDMRSHLMKIHQDQPSDVQSRTPKSALGNNT